MISTLAALAIGAGGGATVSLLVTRILRRKGKPELPTVATKPPPVEWQEGWSKRTTQSAYEALHGHYAMIHEAVDAVDRKAVVLFTISSVILSLVPSLHQLVKWSVSWWIAWGAAGAWVVAVLYGWQAFRPRTFRVYPSPDWTASPDTLSLPPHVFQARLLESVRQSIKHDGDLLNEKGRALNYGLLFAAIEVALLVLTLLVS